MRIEEQTFWLVWAEDGGTPTCKHYTLESARAEARRLAAKHLGVRFVVVMTVGGFHMPKPGPAEIHFQCPDDLLPF